jgi:hypothetical protein
LEKFQGMRLDAAFDHIGVELDAPIVHEPGESVPVGEDIVEIRRPQPESRVIRYTRC